jgi:pimeloyl-ACP methyl ester carboxylesterase
LTRDLAARWPERLPGVRLERVAGAGHYIQKERPERVAREIAELLAERAGRR